MPSSKPTRHRRSISSKSIKRKNNEAQFFTPESPPMPPPRSAPSTYRKPRRNVGDTVCVSSSSRVLLDYSDENTKAVRILDVESVKEIDENAKDFRQKEQAIREKKDLPKIRNRIFEESLESQEISFYIGDESDHHYESLHTAKEEEDYDYDSFESDTESESSMHKTRVLVSSNGKTEVLPKAN
ncbi:hypothetical protein D910_07053 [Dendroctonus ponderosae]|uniref:Uncharacterized protein n=1 Tax=Dendroctonus ponderosae TaxID=77166 RepID=U4UIF8_DENPD|nr:hypothetical protein D910_07053 [Dendroctonus ponderosae]